MVTLDNIVKPVFRTLTPRLNANLGTDAVRFHTLRIGGGYNYLTINNLIQETENEAIHPLISHVHFP